MSHTKNTKNTINKDIIINLNILGTNFNKNHKKIIIIVILNQETATKWVSQELLKDFNISFDISSLAQIKIHQSKTASFSGNVL